MSTNTFSLEESATDWTTADYEQDFQTGYTAI